MRGNAWCCVCRLLDSQVILVDRLLPPAHCGEQLNSWWLGAARYFTPVAVSCSLGGFRLGYRCESSRLTRCCVCLRTVLGVAAADSPALRSSRPTSKLFNRFMMISRLADSIPLLCSLLASLMLLPPQQTDAAEVFVEAESFDDRGGWQLDTQFIQQMGSPYLLAHGLGRPVKDAVTSVDIPQAGKYVVWVRTFDWVARWQAPGTPGRFALLINGSAVADDLGTQGTDWQWHCAGEVELTAGQAELTLRDLTGFNGRCDAIYLTTDAAVKPDNSSEVLPPWRRELLGLQGSIAAAGPYDLVVVGGGYSGMGAAISAARMGCRVALIQDRPVLGGNGSSEVRVWAMGNIRRGRFPRIGEIVEEFADRATKSPGRAEEFGDDLKEEVARAEQNLDLYLNHHAFDVRMQGNKIESVDVLDVKTSQIRRFASPLFVDCTGHGWVGEKAGADWDMTPEGRMGMSNMWTWGEAGEPTEFPETPWALPLKMEDFPYPREYHAQWFWESGFDKDPIRDAEAIRDWNLRGLRSLQRNEERRRRRRSPQRGADVDGVRRRSP